MSDDLEERVAAYLIRYGDEGVFLPKKDAKELIAMFKQDAVEAIEQEKVTVSFQLDQPSFRLGLWHNEVLSVAIKAINQL